MAKTLRVRTRTGWTTKPVEDDPANRLTAEEVDDNFLAMEDESTYVGYVAVSASRTLALTDANTELQCDAAATLTIPANATVAFARGDKIAALSTTTGTVTITAAAGVTLNGVSAGSADLSGQYSAAVITNVGTDAWVINGDHGGVA